MAQAGAAYRRPGQAAMRRRAQRERETRFNRMMFRIAVGLVVVCLFGYIGRMAAISGGAKEIMKLEKELVKLQEDEKYLRISLAARQNMDWVEDQAQGRLGMRAPVEGEVLLVSLNGYASRNNTQTAHDNAVP